VSSLTNSDVFRCLRNWSYDIGKRSLRDWEMHIRKSLSPRLDLPVFWPGAEARREVWLLQTWFGIALVNKLVSLTWLLWALRSFWWFTLRYIVIVMTSGLCCFSARHRIPAAATCDGHGQVPQRVSRSPKGSRGLSDRGRPVTQHVHLRHVRTVQRWKRRRRGWTEHKRNEGGWQTGHWSHLYRLKVQSRLQTSSALA